MAGFTLPTVNPETLVPAAAMLGSARGLGVLMIFPIFSLFNVTGILRFGMAIGLSAPVVALAHASMSATAMSYYDLGGLSFKEFGIGALLGIGLGVPFWAAQAAGDMTDIYRGANAPNLFDQINALETAPLGSMLMSISLVLFVTSGGLIDLIAVFYKSFEFWPLMGYAPVVPYTPLTLLIEIFARIFRTGAVLASPFIIVMAAVELSVSYTARSARQLPLNDMLPTLKNVATIVVLFAYAAFLSSYFQHNWISGFEQVGAILQVPHG